MQFGPSDKAKAVYKECFDVCKETSGFVNGDISERKRGVRCLHFTVEDGE